MAYVSPYVNQMLKKHPLGKEFRIVRELILHSQEGPNAILIYLNNAVDYQGPYKGTYQGSYRSFCVNKFLRIIFSLFSSQSQTGGTIGQTNKTRQCAEEAARRVEVLLKYLDQSKDSQWIVTYMLEDPLKSARLDSSEANFYRPVVNMLETYLKKCQA